MKSGKMALVLVIGAMMLLTACGGGGSSSGGSTAPTATTAQAKGSVNAGEIGGTGLNVLSAQQAATADVKNGSFTTTVSTQGPQFLFLRDSAGKIRGLTLSLPSNSSTASIMAADATSTALALLFLSPGVTTSNSVQAKQVFTALQQMTSFAPFLAFLQANLPTRALDELVQDATYQTLLTACLTEWPGVAATLPPIPVASLAPLAFAVDPKVTPPSTGGFSQAGGVSITADSTTQSAANIPVTIQNYGFRYIKVHKVALDSNGNSVGFEQLADQKGATKFSAGGFLTNTVVTPSSFPDRANFSNGVSKFQYWIVGPGLGSCPECTNFPANVGLNSGIQTTLWLETVLDYIVLESVSVLTGVPLGAIGSQVIPILQTSQGFQNNVTTLLDPTNSAQASSKALVDGTLSIFTALVKSNIIPSAGLSSLLVPFNQIMSGANIATALGWLYSMPSVAKVEITAPYDTIQFANSSYCAQQTDGQISVSVTRNDGSKDPITVQYTIGGTAVSGQDYRDDSTSPGSLKFANEQKEASISLAILKNPSATSQRDATISLEDIDGPGKVGTPSTTTLTIRPDFSGTYTRSFDLGDSSRESYVISGDTVTGSRRRWVDNTFDFGTLKAEIDMQISGTLQPVAPGACSVKITGQSSYTFMNLLSGYVEAQILPFTGGVDSPGRLWWQASPTSPYPFGNIGGLACNYAQCS